jgi:HAMP domain-containing protein
MRLASKIFLTSAVLVVVLAVVGLLSLYAVARLASVNREITTQTVPIVRLVSSLRDAVRALSRLEARYVIRRDPEFATLWDETAARVEADLVQVQAAIATQGQRAATAEAIVAFDQYRELVAEERALLARGNHEQALLLADNEGRVRAERMESMLERLARETDAAVKSALAEATRLEQRTWTWVMASLGMAVVLALVGSGLVAFRLTRSLRRLSAATRALAEGSFSAPITIKDNDEVGELARSFNAMVQQLRQIDDMKEEFFATISHDLKSPLGSIAEAAYLLRDGVAGSLNPRQTRLMSIINASTDRILGLVNRLLLLSRLRAGMLPLERRPVNLAVVAERAMEELRPQAETAEVSLELERIGDAFLVEGRRGSFGRGRHQSRRQCDPVHTEGRVRAGPGNGCRTRGHSRGRGYGDRDPRRGPARHLRALPAGPARPRGERPRARHRAWSGRGPRWPGGSRVCRRQGHAIHGNRATGRRRAMILAGRRWGVRGPTGALIVALALAGCRTGTSPDPRPAFEPAPAPVAAPAPTAAPLPGPLPTPVMPSVILLAEADGLLSEGNHGDAVLAYQDFMARFPEDTAVMRVRATRDILSSLAATKAEVLRLREQTQVAERDLGRLRRDLAVRQAEVGRLRQELAERQAELARLTVEADSLRLDLERLKSVDLRLERPR